MRSARQTDNNSEVVSVLPSLRSEQGAAPLALLCSYPADVAYIFCTPVLPTDEQIAWAADFDGDITLEPKYKVVTEEFCEKCIAAGVKLSSYILNDVAITSDSGNAITVAEGVDAQIVILGESTLTGTNGIYVSEGASVKISGTGSLTAIGKAGNGIGGNGTIEIAGLAALTAEGNGSHAYGIGGDGVESISISNTTINSVVGGCDGEEGTDKSYYKDAPEGGAAIGSGLDGAVINLNDVHVIKAVGGSKSAGIGASYWASVTVNIDNCQIDYVEGGVTAAGIGGSRIHDGDETTTINISNSTITKAVGGTFAAGIGSGYDSYCHVYGEAPICTINISGSTVEAWGGDNAAGIGTGYHAGGLDGVITGDVTGHAGENLKSYPDADAIGFGVLDPSRDGKDNACSISVNGVVITYGE